MLLDPAISDGAKVLAGVLLHHNGPKGCIPAIESLMSETGKSKSSVLRLIEELERYGFLERVRRGRANRYILRPRYERPVAPDSIVVTNALEVENAPRTRPLPRAELRRKKKPNVETELLEAPGRVVELRRSHAAARVTDEQPIAIVEQVSPVTPNGYDDSNRADEQGSPVRPIDVAGDSPEEQVSCVAPVSVSRPAPISLNECHERHLHKIKNQFIKNHHIKTRDAVVGEEKTTDAIALLLAAGVTITRSELGKADRELADDDLAAWATWVRTYRGAAIKNQRAFAAAKLRVGLRVGDVFPEAPAPPMREPRDLVAEDARAAAEEEAQTRRADDAIAALDPADRTRLRDAALADFVVWIARKSERFDLILRATERRLAVCGMPSVILKRDYGDCAVQMHVGYESART
jgi:hypothetical protein